MKSVKFQLPKFVFLIYISLFIQCSSKENTSISADYLFTNAKVYTVNKNQPWAETVAVKNNKIVFVGSSSGKKHDQGFMRRLGSSQIREILNQSSKKRPLIY